MKNKSIIWISLGVLALGVGAFFLLKPKKKQDEMLGDETPSAEEPSLATPTFVPKEIKIRFPSEKKQSQMNLAKKLGLSPDTINKINMSITPTNIGMGSYNFPPTATNVQAINRITGATKTTYRPSSPTATNEQAINRITGATKTTYRPSSFGNIK
jgi:hypothetical protein